MSVTEQIDVVRAEARAALEAINQFDAIVEKYLKCTGSLQTQFGKETGGGIDFVRHMRQGRNLRRETLRRVLAHIAEGVAFVEPS